MWHNKVLRKGGGMLGAPLILLIGIALIVGCATYSEDRQAVQHSQEEGNRHYSVARGLMMDGRYEEAEEKLTLAIQKFEEVKRLCRMARDCRLDYNALNQTFQTAYSGRMKARYHAKKDELAIQDAKKVLSYDDRDKDAHFVLGYCSAEIWDLDTARRELNVLKSLDKEGAKALEKKIKEQEADASFGELLFELFEIISNDKLLEEGIDPQNAVDEGNKAYGEGNYDQAIAFYTYAIESEKLSRKDLGIVHRTRGHAYYRKNQYEKAIAEYSKAIELNPKDPDGNNGLAWLLCTCSSGKYRDGKRAVVLAKKAVELSGGGNPIIIDTLAAAYAEVGRFNEAIRTQERVIAILKKKGASNIPEYVKHLESYKAHKPWRE